MKGAPPRPMLVSEPTLEVDDHDLQELGEETARRGLGVWKNLMFGAARSAAASTKNPKRKPADKPAKPARKSAAKPVAEPPRVVATKSSTPPPSRRVKPLLDSQGMLSAGAPEPARRVRVAKRKDTPAPPPMVEPRALPTKTPTLTLTQNIDLDRPLAPRPPPVPAECAEEITASVVVDPVMLEDDLDTMEVGHLIQELRAARSEPPPAPSWSAAAFEPTELVAPRRPIEPEERTAILTPAPWPPLGFAATAPITPMPSVSPFVATLPTPPASAPPPPMAIPVAAAPVRARRSMGWTFAAVLFLLATIGAGAVYARPALLRAAASPAAPPRQASTTSVVTPPEADAPAAVSLVSRAPGAPEPTTNDAAKDPVAKDAVAKDAVAKDSKDASSKEAKDAPSTSKAASSRIAAPRVAVRPAPVAAPRPQARPAPRASGGIAPGDPLPPRKSNAADADEANEQLNRARGETEATL